MRVDADDFARSCSYGKEYMEAREVLIEADAIKMLEEEMSEGALKTCISPLVLCTTDIDDATEEMLEDICDRCQVLVLDAEGLQADEQALAIVENNMDDDIDLVLAVGSEVIHAISRCVAERYHIPCISLINAEDNIDD